MILQDEPFKYFGFWDAVEMGLNYVIVGYYFLIFAYFLLMRFRMSKKLYWFFFSVLFICLAAAGVFFIVYYWYTPELEMSDSNMVAALMLQYRLATFFTWMATASVMGVLGILLFPPEAKVEQKPAEKSGASNKKIVLSENMKLALRFALIAFPIVIGILALTLPDSLFMDPAFKEDYNYKIDLVVITIGDWSYPAGRFVLNFVFMPLFIAIIPFIFLYLAWKTFGVLRKSYLLNGIGFLLYYAGRISQGIFDVIKWEHVSAIVPQLMILISLLIIVIANNYEQLR